MTQYDVERWPEATTRGRHVFTHRFRMFGHELKGWSLVKVVPMQELDDIRETVYFWRDEKDFRRVVRIGVDELDSWRSAHKRLLTTLEHCMHPSIPAGTAQMASVGDVNRVARDPRSDIPAAVFFTRGNVSVSVNSADDVTVDVSQIAESLDRALSDSPRETRLARRVSPRSMAAKRAGRARLIPSLSRATPKDAWLKVIAPDGELMRVGDRLFYRTSKAGTKRIHTFVMKGR